MNRKELLKRAALTAVGLLAGAAGMKCARAAEAATPCPVVNGLTIHPVDIDTGVCERCGKSKMGDRDVTVASRAYMERHKQATTEYVNRTIKIAAEA